MHKYARKQAIYIQNQSNAIKYITLQRKRQIFIAFGRDASHAHLFFMQMQKISRNAPRRLFHTSRPAPLLYFYKKFLYNIYRKLRKNFRENYE